MSIAETQFQSLTPRELTSPGGVKLREWLTPSNELCTGTMLHPYHPDGTGRDASHPT